MHFARFNIIFTVFVAAEKLLCFVSLREPEITQVPREASVGKEVPCILAIWGKTWKFGLLVSASLL